MSDARLELPPTEELEGLGLFNGVDVSKLQHLLARCPVHTLAENAVLIAAGEPNHHLYLVLSGRLRVHLHMNDNLPVAILETSESVGEISLIDHQPTSAYVIADCEARVLAIDEELLWSLVRSSHEVAINLLQILAQRLRHGNSVIHRIQQLLREYEYDATIDPLTGLFNRRWLAHMLRRLVQRAASDRQRLAVAMIDIDHFKRYNDEYGHLAGDRALHAVARCLAEHLRPEDTITRYGGEELLAILPGSNLAGARQIGERLRDAVTKLRVQLTDGRELPPPSISVGVAELAPGQSPDALVAAADEALYRAKRAGRNRVST